MLPPPPADDHPTFDRPRRSGPSFLTRVQRCERIRRGARLDKVMMATPRPPAVPCRFGLTDGELSREAKRLRASGWTAAEVADVLVRPAAEAP